MKEGPAPGTYDPDDLPSSKNKKVDFTAMNRAPKQSYMNKIIKSKQDMPGIGAYDLALIDKGY